MCSFRTVVAILDNFHFTISEPSAGKEDDDAGLSERIHKSIVGFVLPCLESCLTLKVIIDIVIVVIDCVSRNCLIID